MVRLEVGQMREDDDQDEQDERDEKTVRAKRGRAGQPRREGATRSHKQAQRSQEGHATPRLGSGQHAASGDEQPLAMRQERAVTLLCQGMRPAAIAAALGTTPATVRRWVRRRFEAMAREARDDHVTALLQAIESQREIVRAAWEAYAHEREVEAAILRGELDFVRRRAVRRPDTGSRGGRSSSRGKRDARTASDSGEPGPTDETAEELLLEEYERPKHANQGAKYLAVTLAAQREMARLLGLYDEIAQEPAQISITITRRPDGPENIPPGQRPSLPALPALRDEDESGDENNAAEDEEPDANGNEVSR